MYDIHTHTHTLTAVLFKFLMYRMYYRDLCIYKYHIDHI